MAGSLIKNIVVFTNVGTDTPVVKPHGLNLNGDKLIPKLVASNAPGFIVTADDTNLSVIAEAASSGSSVNIFVEYFFGGVLDPLAPFVIPSPPGPVPFLYTADGTETDEFDMPIPPRANTNFAAHVAGGGLGAFLLFDVVQALNTTTSIRVRCSAPLELNDVLVVFFGDLA